MLLQNISKELKNIFNLKADQENELETYNEVKTGAICNAHLVHWTQYKF
jgi:hypothetical protein